VPGTAQESDEPRLPGLAARTAVPSSLSPAGVKLSGGGRPSDYYPPRSAPPLLLCLSKRAQIRRNRATVSGRIVYLRWPSAARKKGVKTRALCGERPGELGSISACGAVRARSALRQSHHVATWLAAPVRARVLIAMRVLGVSTPGRFRPRQARSSTSLRGLVRQLGLEASTCKKKIVRQAGN
jgi:hypothetical protein